MKIRYHDNKGNITQLVYYIRFRMLQDFLSVGVGFIILLVVTVSGLSTDIGQWILPLPCKRMGRPPLFIIVGLRTHKSNSLYKRSFNRGKPGKVKEK